MMIPMLPELPELSRETIEAIVVCATVIVSAALIGWFMTDINDHQNDTEFEHENTGKEE